MGYFDFSNSCHYSRKAITTVPWVRYDVNGKIVESGRMLKKDILPSLQKNELIAHNMLLESNADHVLYGLKIYDRNDELEIVQFYNWLMDEEKFQRCATKCRNGIIYALHRR